MGKAAWSNEEKQYIKEHWMNSTDSEMSDHLGRSPKAVAAVRREFHLYRNAPWTEDEELQLMDMWGTASIPGIANRLNRSVDAIKIKAAKLGLGAVLMAGDYVTFCQLLKAVTGTLTGYSYKMCSWVRNRGLPLHTKKVNKCSFRVVYLEEFWEWAERNRSFIDFSKMEPLALGVEPEWVSEQRKKDYRAFRLQRKDPWTPGEDAELIRLLRQFRYGYAELSEMLNRSVGAIQRRCCDLGIKERPIKATKTRDWTDGDFCIVADGIRAGESYSEIGRAVGRSEKAVRGKVYYTYLTEDADRVRKMMGSGSFGDGAPDPTVRQAFNLSRTRKDTVAALSRLVTVLRYRMNELGYEPYWQRFMCMNWDDIAGCKAGELNCDECTSFIRIKPQFCVRCGVTFHERSQSLYCERCRVIRKKQYQMLWASKSKTAIRRSS